MTDAAPVQNMVNADLSCPGTFTQSANHDRRPSDDALIRNIADGLTYDEIAAMHGMTRSAVSGRVYRLRRAGRLIQVRMKRGQGRALHEFAERLSCHGDEFRAAAEMGLSAATARTYLKRIRKRLGWQAC